MYDPFAHAEALNIQVLHRPLTKSHELWLPQYNTIVLKSGMRPASQRCALAHGIGHADLGHAENSPKAEMQADRYASVFLIDPAEFADVCSWEYSPSRVAAELGVTRRLLGAYLDWTHPEGPRIAPLPGSYEDHLELPTDTPGLSSGLSDQRSA